MLKLVWCVPESNPRSTLLNCIVAKTPQGSNESLTRKGILGAHGKGHTSLLSKLSLHYLGPAAGLPAWIQGEVAQHPLSEPCHPSAGNPQNKQRGYAVVFPWSPHPRSWEGQKDLLRQRREMKTSRAQQGLAGMAWNKLRFVRSTSQNGLSGPIPKKTGMGKGPALDDRKFHEAGESGQPARKASTL